MKDEIKITIIRKKGRKDESRETKRQFDNTESAILGKIRSASIASCPSNAWGTFLG
jgi:hypothetical protein